ncbi:oxidoreductase [Acidothermaceae bacterium B102]|nr:oxidoreductase [Acidothermaceae bacterium B102]
MTLSLDGVQPGPTDRWAAVAALPGVADAVIDARRAVDRVLVHRVVRTRAAALAAESALRGARESAALSGEDVSLDDARAGEAGHPVLAGALRVHAELPRLRAVWATSPRQALARLHLLAAADLATIDDLGRPSTERGAAALGQVAALASSSTSAPALLVAAVVHGELLLAAPFGSANAVVARAAARLVLAARGLDPSLLTMVEVGHVELGDYAEASAAYQKGEPAGVARWVLHCARAVELGASESLAVAEAVARG